MKVVFVFGGIPHYYNKILNLLNSQKGLEITVITPTKKGQTIGVGVYETEQGITFKRIELTEYKTWYGKPFFKDFYTTIEDLSPDIVVSGWPYFINFIFSLKRINKLKSKGVRFVAKEIPFSVQRLLDTIEEFNKNTSFDQRKERIYSSKFYFRMVKWIRKKLYSKVIDAAVVYLEKGKGILSSYGLDKKNIVVTYNSIVTEDIFKTIAKKIYTDTPLVDEVDMVFSEDSALNKKYDSYLEKSRKEYKTVPNVVGMSGMDAISLLENLGMKVFVKGNGKVKKQSLNVGEKITVAKEIVLELS